MPEDKQIDAASTGGIKKSAITLVVLLEIGAIVILAALIYNTLFPEAYWQSRELDQNLAKWQSQHITHYRMSVHLPYSTMRASPTPFTVDVRDGKVVSVVDALGQRISSENDADFSYDSQYFTIPGLFSYAYQTIWEKPPLIRVFYDPALGYPDSIYVDPYTEPCCQDFAIAVQDFQVLPPNGFFKVA